jgi:hypothetical protein
MTLAGRYYSLRWWKIFLLVLSSYFLTTLISQSLINEIVYYNSYSEQLTYDRAMELYGMLKKYSWIGFALFPFVLLIKITTISLVIYTGVIFFNLHKQLSIGMMFRVVTASEIVFVTAGIVKILWFYFFAGNYTIPDINFFYPASLINLFHRGEIDKIWIFPLQTLNLFHIGYIFLLAYGIKQTGKIDKWSSEKIVAITYIPAIFIWIALVMFLSINTET